MGKKLINWLCLSGVLSIIFYLLHDIVGVMNYQVIIGRVKQLVI